MKTRLILDHLLVFLEVSHGFMDGIEKVLVFRHGVTTNIPFN
jgi:hypothetical protein